MNGTWAYTTLQIPLSDYDEPTTPPAVQKNNDHVPLTDPINLSLEHWEQPEDAFVTGKHISSSARDRSGYLPEKQLEWVADSSLSYTNGVGWFQFVTSYTAATPPDTSCIYRTQPRWTIVPPTNKSCPNPKDVFLAQDDSLFKQYRKTQNLEPHSQNPRFSVLLRLSKSHQKSKTCVSNKITSWFSISFLLHLATKSLQNKRRNNVIFLTTKIVHPV